MEGDICPNCKKGHMHLQGKRGSDGEPKGKFRETGDITEYVCDAKCGYTQKAIGRRLYEDVRVSDKADVTVTKADEEK